MSIARWQLQTLGTRLDDAEEGFEGGFVLEASALRGRSVWKMSSSSERSAKKTAWRVYSWVLRGIACKRL